MNFADRVCVALTSDPGRMVFEAGAQTLCAREALGLADALDQALVGQGVGPGARVAVLVKPNVAHLGAIISLWKTRRCVVLVSSMQTPERLRDELNRLDLEAIVGAADDLSAPLVKGVVRKRGLGELHLTGRLEDPVHSQEIWKRREADPTQAFVNFPTSGTTGEPKRISFDSAVAEGVADDFAAMFEEIEGAPRFTPVVVPYPVAAMSGLAFLIYAAAYARPLVVLERFEVESWVRAMRAWPQRVAYLPPAGMRMLLSADVDPKVLHETIAVRSGAAPLDLKTRLAFEQRFHVKVLSQYGASEFCGIVTTVRLSDHERAGGTVGQPRPGINLRVVPDAGADQREVGVLEVQANRLGPNWFRTTDLATIDQEGRLTLLGRADNAINRGGFKIVPSVIEDALRQHTSVQDAVAIGIADERLGECPVAAVELVAGARALSEAELGAYLRSILLSYQVPTKICILDRLPRNAGMKVDLTKLRALIAQN